MNLNKISFLMSKVYHLNYNQCIPTRKKSREKILEALLDMCNEYKQIGVFHVTQIEVKDAYKSLKSELQGKAFQVKLVTCHANKHMPRAERGMRELKDRI